MEKKRFNPKWTYVGMRAEKGDGMYILRIYEQKHGEVDDPRFKLRQSRECSEKHPLTADYVVRKMLGDTAHDPDPLTIICLSNPRGSSYEHEPYRVVLFDAKIGCDGEVFKQRGSFVASYEDSFKPTKESMIEKLDSLPGFIKVSLDNEICKTSERIRDRGKAWSSRFIEKEEKEWFEDSVYVSKSVFGLMSSPIVFRSYDCYGWHIIAVTFSQSDYAGLVPEFKNSPVAEEFTLCCSTAKKTLVLSEQAKEIGLKTEISDSYQDKLLIDSLKE